MILNESIKPATPYMIRNDGKVSDRYTIEK